LYRSHSSCLSEAHITSISDSTDVKHFTVATHPMVLHLAV